MESDFIEIEILNWDKYNPRTDAKNHSWFRFEHSLIESPEFFKWPGNHIKVLIYLLSQAAKKKRSRIRIYPEHAVSAIVVSDHDVRETIQKLVFMDFAKVHSKSYGEVTLSNFPVTSKVAVPTNERTNETNETNETLRNERTDLKLPATPSAGSASSAGPLVWEAYRDEYQNRYGEEPIRNASVNSKIAQFAKRLPIDEAPEVARFYVRHPDAFYVKQLHPVGLLLKDAEALRTQWARGKTITGTDARTVERRQTNADAFSAAFRTLNQGESNGDV